MWNSLSNFAQKAQVFVDQNLQPALNNLAPSDNRSSKAALFRHQFRLPDSQNPLYEITAELTLPPKTPSSSKSPTDTPRKSHEQRNNWDRERGNHYVGRLHLSEKFLCFSTQNSSFSPTASTSLSTVFTGQTNGAGPAGNGFTLPLCAVRRVERLHSQSYMFALSITTWNGYPAADEKNTKHTGKTAPPAPKLTIQLAGSRVQCEKFCDMLKKGLREGMREVDGMRKVVGECYSEYMLAAEAKRRNEKDAPAGKLIDDQNPEEQLKPPDAGLGMQFRYPGDPKKLRDKGKMRLWYEYLRGKAHLFLTTMETLLTACRKWPQCHSCQTTRSPSARENWSTEQTSWRSVGAHIRLLLPTNATTQALPGHISKIRGPTFARYRRDRKRPESQSARVPWFPERRRYRPPTPRSHCVQLDQPRSWLLSSHEYRCGCSVDLSLRNPSFLPSSHSLRSSPTRLLLANHVRHSLGSTSLRITC